MKKLSLVILALVLVAFMGSSAFTFIKEKVHKDLNVPITYPSATPLPSGTSNLSRKTTVAHASLFIPYWAIADQLPKDRQYDEFIYFGIAPMLEGVDRKEVGFSRVDDFFGMIPQGSKTLLTIRMTDTQRNLLILKNPKSQERIIEDSIVFAKDNHFDGIVLDLEIAAIPFDSLIKQVDTFTKLLYAKTKKNNLSLSLALYGDTFYRLRPFEVKTLVKNTDRVFIMAYDLHKSRGNPGPNFPLRGEDVYGYDLTKMADDFLKFIPVNKATVIFGMFGYDWIVDGRDKSTEVARPLTDLEINDKFLTACLYRNCVVKRDSQSSETQIRYTDDEGRNHIVWFEDTQSVSVKRKYLEERGISSFSFWASSYF